MTHDTQERESIAQQAETLAEALDALPLNCPMERAQSLIIATLQRVQAQTWEQSACRIEEHRMLDEAQQLVLGEEFRELAKQHEKAQK